MVKISFPEGFLWGSSTAAAQIETAFDHQWKGIKSEDNNIFDRTIDHEKQREADLDYIRQFGSIYRCSLDWSRLQREPFGTFDEKTVKEYKQFFQMLNYSGMQIMLVLHHFAHPIWFEKRGAWLIEDNIPYFIDFVRQCEQHFGDHVYYWNTFNEPNVYAMNAYLLGKFPPFQKNNINNALKVLQNIGLAHKSAYTFLKEQDASDQVGISLNTAWFKSYHWLGLPIAKFLDWAFNKYPASLFDKIDFWGLSYYAYVPCAPFPLTYLDNAHKMDKLKIKHDKMWGYNPKGLGKMLVRFYKKYKKPIFVTENGICTDDPTERIEAIKNYLAVCHSAIQKGVPLKGYIHWSTFDNFEWNLGPTYRFGLVSIDWESKERTMNEAGVFYSNAIRENAIEI